MEGVGLAGVDAELAAVELMRELRAAGATLPAIAAELNQRGIPTKRGGRWHATTVKNILDRAAR